MKETKIRFLVLFASFFVLVGCTEKERVLDTIIEEFEVRTTYPPSAFATAARKAGVPYGLDQPVMFKKKVALEFDYEGIALEKLLDAIVEQAPGYRWDWDQGVLNFIYEQADSQDAKILEMLIERFKVEEETFRSAVNRLYRRKELGRRLSFVVPGKIEKRKVTLDLKRARVRHILNLLIREQGDVVWLRLGRKVYFQTIGSEPN